MKESDLHTKRTGHTEFADKTSEAAKPISLEAPKPKDDVDMVEAGNGSNSNKEGNDYIHILKAKLVIVFDLPSTINSLLY